MIRSVEEDLTLTDPIVQQDFKATGGSHQKLKAFLVGMGTSGFTPWNVVKIKDPLYVEWKMNLIFNRRDVPGPKWNAGKRYDGCVVNSFQRLLGVSLRN